MVDGKGQIAVGRLAPTPSGQLHLGNICSFALAWLSIRAQGGRLLLRIEDIDQTRARPGVEADMRAELDWLGLHWDEETPRQSTRSYAEILEQIQPHTYYCECTRAQIKNSGGVYRGTCREKGLGRGALRFRLPAGQVPFVDRRWGVRMEDPTQYGDPILLGRDGVPTYTLAVVADDIRDGVTEVVRGADLLDYSTVQLCLWEALGASPPSWLHGPLILGVDQKKLSKSHDAFHVGALREAGWSPDQIWRVLFPCLGLEKAASLQEAVALFKPRGGVRGPIVLRLGKEGVPSPGTPISWSSFG